MRRGISGRVWRISTRNDDDDFIVSDRLEQQGISDAITENGIHYGVEVRGKVFDNLSKQGLPLQEWQHDFHSQFDEFDVTLIEEF
jgi:Papain fold toxin 2